MQTTQRDAPHHTPSNAHHTAQHNTTRDSIFNISVSPASQRSTSTVPTSQYLQDRSISGAGYLQHRSMSNIAVFRARRYFQHRGISEISNRKLWQTLPMAALAVTAPAAGRAFFNRFLIEILHKSAPGRLRVAGRRFLLDFYWKSFPNLARAAPAAGRPFSYRFLIEIF